ncbi:MAG: 50S ribosomal protein L25 [Deltaproteobacteria bacterium]|nr:50S ribosomal protein L25 [Deltaproteobacteria bacterium]
MEQETLSIDLRNDTGKGVARKLRQSGKIPGVLYGLGSHRAIAVDPKAVHSQLMQGGRNRICKLKGTDVDGKLALIKDYQVDPVSRKLLHVDLLEIDVQQKIQVTVALNFTGKSLGVAEGGILNIVNREIKVRCLPTQIPKVIDVDVTALKIGDSVHLDQLTLPEGIEKVAQANATLVTVVPPTKEEELAPSLTPTAEPEVITEKKAEGAEGEAAAAGGDEKAAPKEEKKKEEKKK